MDAHATPPYLSADEDLQHRVANYLVGYRMPALRDIEVEVSEGTVLLRGCVGSYYQKQLCLHCCHRVAGVREITDQIVVQPSYGPISRGSTRPR